MASDHSSSAREFQLAEVVEREYRLLDPAFRADPDAVRRLLHEDFEEVGASGRQWDRDAIVAELAQDPGHGTETSEVSDTLLAPGVVLVTYLARSLGPGRSVSRRSSIWIDESGHWTVRHHQGTPAG